MGKHDRFINYCLENGALQTNEDTGFVLSNGEKSPYFFDASHILLRQQGLNYVMSEFSPRMKYIGIVGGPASGALPIISAAVLNWRMPGFYGKIDTVTYGIIGERYKMYSTIEGPLEKGMAVGLVDDVCHTGEQLRAVFRAVVDYGCIVSSICVVVDRGGVERLKDLHIPVRSILHMGEDGVLTDGNI